MIGSYFWCLENRVRQTTERWRCQAVTLAFDWPLSARHPATDWYLGVRGTWNHGTEMDLSITSVFKEILKEMCTAINSLNFDFPTHRHWWFSFSCAWVAQLQPRHLVCGSTSCGTAAGSPYGILCRSLYTGSGTGSDHPGLWIPCERTLKHRWQQVQYIHYRQTFIDHLRIQKFKLMDPSCMKPEKKLSRLSKFKSPFSPVSSTCMRQPSSPASPWPACLLPPANIVIRHTWWQFRVCIARRQWGTST